MLKTSRRTFLRECSKRSFATDLLLFARSCRENMAMRKLERWLRPWDTRPTGSLTVVTFLCRALMRIAVPPKISCSRRFAGDVVNDLEAFWELRQTSCLLAS